MTLNTTRRKKNGFVHTFKTAFALFTAVLAAAVLLFSGCAGNKPDPSGDISADIVEVLPAATPDSVIVPETSQPAALPTEAYFTPAPTDEPAAIEAKLLSGLVHPLNGGEPMSASWQGESVDIYGDGEPNRIHVANVDGGATLCIDGEPFLDCGTRVFLTSLDGKNIVFLSQKPDSEGYFVFYPQRGGNLFCRLFGIARTGDPAFLAHKASCEEYIRAGLDIMLHNPLLYTSVDGASRTLRLDMDGDGSKDEIRFDSELLSVNGQRNEKILSTTMPRFIWDAEHGCIALSGSAGDYALNLRLENGLLTEDISYAQLL